MGISFGMIQQILDSARRKTTGALGADTVLVFEEHSEQAFHVAEKKLRTGCFASDLKIKLWGIHYEQKHA